jgi:hypothetical protein
LSSTPLGQAATDKQMPAGSSFAGWSHLRARTCFFMDWCLTMQFR